MNAFLAILKALLPVLGPLLEALTSKPTPPPQAPPPPAHQDQLPDPVVVITPAPPVIPGTVQFQGLQLNITKLYHQWFRREIQPGVLSDDNAATPEEMTAILQGQQALPSGSQIAYSVEPFPPGLTINDIPIPLTLIVSMAPQAAHKNDPQAISGTDAFTPEPGHTGHYAGSIANVQGQQPPGVGQFDRSNGYAGIISLMETQVISEVWITVKGTINGKSYNSNTIHFPWDARPSTAQG